MNALSVCEHMGIKKAHQLDGGVRDLHKAPARAGWPTSELVAFPHPYYVAGEFGDI